MPKERQKKDDVIEAPAASGKMSRKDFEKELSKLQVELTRLQTWVSFHSALHRAFPGGGRDRPLRPLVVQPGRGRAGDGLRHR
jgi:hypothetical protein